MNLLLDLGTTSPVALHPETMSNGVARLLVDRLRTGNYSTTVANDEFLLSCSDKKWYSPRQKKYIYNIAHRLHAL